jgi:hypothetical protein
VCSNNDFKIYESITDYVRIAYMPNALFFHKHNAPIMSPDTQISGLRSGDPEPDTQISGLRSGDPEPDTQISGLRSGDPEPDTQISGPRSGDPEPDTQISGPAKEI